MNQELETVVYPQAYLDELWEEYKLVKDKLDAGELPVYSTIDALFEALESD